MIYDSEVYPDQFVFQRRYAEGRVLNVGCNTDGAGLGRLPGAVNVDIAAVDFDGAPLPVTVVADARALPFGCAFDTVVLGEILEHMERPDAVLSLFESSRCLLPGGAVVVTLPHDPRRADGRLPLPPAEKQFYAKGVYAFHYRPIGRAELMQWILDAGLVAERMGRIFYPWGEEGSGVVARRAIA